MMSKFKSWPQSFIIRMSLEEDGQWEAVAKMGIFKGGCFQIWSRGRSANPGLAVYNACQELFKKLPEVFYSKNGK